MTIPILMSLAAALLVGVHATAGPPEDSFRLQRGERSRVIRASSTARRGRPWKFGRPSRVVNLTLPDDVVERLKTLDDDLSRAVVRVTETAVTQQAPSGAELTTHGTGALIVVPGSHALLEQMGVELVPISSERAILAFNDAQGVPQFELQVLDALRNPGLDGTDRATLELLADVLGSSRRGDGPQIRQRRIIILHWTDPKTPTA
jgi:hypothetical protein